MECSCPVSVWFLLLKQKCSAAFSHIIVQLKYRFIILDVDIAQFQSGWFTGLFHIIAFDIYPCCEVLTVTWSGDKWFPLYTGTWKHGWNDVSSTKYNQNKHLFSLFSDADYHEQDKIINQLRMRVAVLEQEIKDKEQVLTKSSDLLGAEQDKKVVNLIVL